MKKQLLALSLVATCGLVAQEGMQNQAPAHQSNACNTCRCNPCSCKPCCVPKPKKCIDCECYTPQYYDLQCDWGTFISVDFLYWYAREANLAYAQQFVVLDEVSGGNNSAAFPTSYKYTDAKWDPGVRVGLGFNSECDGWDWSIVWTYYRNTSSKTSTVTYDTGSEFPVVNEPGLVNPWTNTNVEVFQTPVFDSIKGNWKFTFNQIDLALGRKYWLSPCFTLRPYTAIRGMWTKTDFNVTGSTLPRTATSGATDRQKSTSDQFRNKYWGVGFLTGIQPNWFMCRTFALYGDVDAALVWGDFKGRKKEAYLVTEVDNSVATTLVDVANTANGNDFGRMLAMIDLAIGLRWVDNYCCDRYSFGLDLGWEHHILLNTGLYYKNSGSVAQGTTRFSEGFNEVRTDIGMGGLVVRLRFDF